MEKDITMAYAALLPQPERQCSQTYSTLPKRTRLYWRTCTGLSAPQKSFESVVDLSITSINLQGGKEVDSNQMPILGVFLKKRGD